MPAWPQSIPLAVEKDDDDDDRSDGDAPRRELAVFQSKPTERVSYELLGGALPEQALFYGGFDVWRHGFAAWGGIQWAPDRFLANRLFLRMTSSETVERFNAANKTFTTQIFRGAFLSGIVVQRERVELQLYAGPDSQFDVVRPDDIFFRKRGLRFGVRAGLDAWWQPTKGTMISGALSASTIGASANARLAAGVTVFERFWVGPEISASTDEFSRQLRVGAHVTGLRYAAIEWSAASGIVHDSYGRSGVYGRVGLFKRQ